MNHIKKAEENFIKGYNCAQAVFAAFSTELNIDESTALKLSSSFGGGMGRMREVCGAVSAMFMIAGLLYGYDSFNDDQAKKEHYARIQFLAEKFRESHNSIICRELLQNLQIDNASQPSERTNEYYKERPCLTFVADAVKIMDEYISSNPPHGENHVNF